MRGEPDGGAERECDERDGNGNGEFDRGEREFAPRQAVGRRRRNCIGGAVLSSCAAPEAVGAGVDGAGAACCCRQRACGVRQRRKLGTKTNQPANPGTTTGAYTITVTGTGSDAAATAASTTFTLTVN